MAVRIRLTRVGATKRPAYRVVAIDRRRSRDGRALEILGFYDPLTDPATVKLDTERINAWIGKGAQPSDTVVKLMRQASAPPRPAPEKPKRTRSARPKAAAAAEPAAPDAAATSPAPGEDGAATADTPETVEPTAAAAPEAPVETDTAAEAADAPASDDAERSEA